MRQKITHHGCAAGIGRSGGLRRRRDRIIIFFLLLLSEKIFSNPWKTFRYFNRFERSGKQSGNERGRFFFFPFAAVAKILSGHQTTPKKEALFFVLKSKNLQKIVKFENEMSARESGKKKTAKAPKKELKQIEDDAAAKGKTSEQTKNVKEGKVKTSRKGPVSNTGSKKVSKK